MLVSIARPVGVNMFAFAEGGAPVFPEAVSIVRPVSVNMFAFDGGLPRQCFEQSLIARGLVR